MNVSLTPQLAKRVNEQVRSGDYASASEVMREALRGHFFRKKERARQIKELRRMIREGEESAAREGWIPADQVMRELRPGARGKGKAA